MLKPSATTATLAWTLLVAAALPALPALAEDPVALADLTVAALTLDPGAPRDGEAVTFTAEVRNVGDADAGAFDVGFALDGGALGTVRVDTLAAGAATNVTFGPWSALDGEHAVVALADSAAAVVESDEANNELRAPFKVGPPRMPDLHVLALKADDASPAAGQELTFTAEVENAGEADAGPFVVRFLVDGASLGDASVAGLAAGARANVTSAGWTAVEGDHTARAEADAEDAAKESDEANNAREAALSVAAAPLPDLTVLDLQLTPAAPDAGDAVAFVATVRNIGHADAGSFEVEFLVDGHSIGNATVAGLDAGASANVASPSWAAVAGSHHARAAADAAGALAEEREDNNAREEAFRVGPVPPPDLIVADITWLPGAPKAGQDTTFTAEVRNRGDGDAGAFRVRFLVDGALLGEASAEGLEAGHALSVASPAWSAAVGNHTVRAVADPDDEVDESQETNNARQERVSVARAVAGIAQVGEGEEGVAVCHIPPGNPGNAHTIHVGASAVQAHLAHGDHEGACGSQEEGPSVAGAADRPGRRVGQERAERAGSAADAPGPPDHAVARGRSAHGPAEVVSESLEPLSAALAALPSQPLALAGLAAAGTAGAGAVLWMRRR